jgi:L-malate glycosyltransferase
LKLGSGGVSGGIPLWSGRRILVLSTGYSGLGGIAYRTRLIVEGLREAGCVVVVLAVSDDGRRLRWKPSEGLVVLEVPGFGRRWIGALLFAVTATPVACVLSRRAAALVAIQASRSAWVAVVAGSVGRSPVAVWGTLSGPAGDAAHVDRGHLRAVRRLLLSRASVLVAQTPVMAYEMRALRLQVPVVVVPNPVRLPDSTPSLNGEERVAFAGRLSEEKGLFCLLDAWKRIAVDNSAAELVLIGAGGAYRSVEASLRTAVAADASLTRSVRFTGWVDDPTDLLITADVFVLPSIAEGMSNALLQACALGRVVVASDIAENRAVVGDVYPLLFKVGNPMALEASIRTALFDPQVRTRALGLIAARMVDFQSATVISRLAEAVLGVTDRPIRSG